MTRDQPELEARAAPAPEPLAEPEPTVDESIDRVRERLERDGSVSPDGERVARWLVGHILNVDHRRLPALARHRLPPGAETELLALADRLRAGEPLAYVIGSADFLDMTLAVGPGVLIPRPETEGLAEWAIRRTPSAGRPVVVDVGTGAGPLALAIARARPNAVVHGTDLSAAALDFARANAERIGVADAVVWHQVDLLPEAPERFDLVVANLPYVGTAELDLVEPGVLGHEPHAALFAGPDGLETIRRLLDRLRGRLASCAAVGLEIGWRQGPAVVRAAREAIPGARVRLRADLAGRARYVLVETGAGRGQRSGLSPGVER